MRRKKREIFNNKEVTEMMSRYARNPKSHPHLRDKILKRAMRLVDAAISKKGAFAIIPGMGTRAHREDLRQDCALKILQGLEKFDPDRGSAFAFLWTIACNTCTTQNQRLSRTDTVSLSTDEDAQRQAEQSGPSVYEAPENRHILNRLGRDIQRAFETNGFKIPQKKTHQRVCADIRNSIQSGELFYNRMAVMAKLRSYGLRRDDVQYYIDYTLVRVRQNLLQAREDASALTVREVGKDLSEISSE